MTGRLMKSATKLPELKVGFMSWTRSAAMWIVWNVKVGKLAPLLMSYALQSKSYKKDQTSEQDDE